MYRRLSQSEVQSLERQNCTAENWSQIEVKEPFSTTVISNVRFAGYLKIGALTGKVQVEDNIWKSSGIENCHIENCTIGDQVCLSNIGTLANYNIGSNVTIENVGTLAVNRETTFGNGHEIEVLNEGGGRELPIYDKLSAQLAYMIVIYRHDKTLVEKLKKLVADYAESKRSSVGEIGDNSTIIHSKSILNVNIGPHSKLRGVSMLKEGTVAGNKNAPVYIGEDVIANNFIVLSGSRIDGGVHLSSTFVGQGVQLGKQFSAENSAFFANCEGFHGEACSIFAGPYSVTHHKSTLLIAGMYSFFNAGSGTNQSNHMYKLGPVHQGVVERGSKTGSFSYMLWPCRVGAFSVVMDKHGGNFDTSELPFSYLNVQNDKTIVTPAMNLFTVGTARDSKKWPKRDRRKDPEKHDLINFELLNPYTVQKIITGSELLNSLHQNALKTREFVTHKGAHINRLMLRTSKRYYDLAINVYLTQQLYARLINSTWNSIEDIRKVLLPGQQPNQDFWIDMAGMIARKSSVEKLIQKIVEEKIKTLEEVQSALQRIHDDYEAEAYSWCSAAIRNRWNTDVQNITADELLNLLGEWKANAVKFKNMVLKDAEKEFDQHSRIGFAPDGDEVDNLADFKNIRGKYETNSFVSEIKKELEDIDSEYNSLVKKLQSIQS